jgi:cell division protein FtsI (penicillin-binding protein 3)
MAGKTGTAAVNYAKMVEQVILCFLVRWLFPADKPKYSCIVVVHKPSTVNNYYEQMLRSRFKRIAQKIFTDVPSTNEIKFK